MCFGESSFFFVFFFCVRPVRLTEEEVLPGETGFHGTAFKDDMHQFHYLNY